MKSRTSIIVALVLIAGLVVGFGARAMAQDGDSGDETTPPKTITVSASATVGSEPDQAVLTLGINRQNADGPTALNETSAVSDAVLAALKAAGVAADDVQTTRMDFDQRTVDRRTPQEHTVYVASTTLEVTVHDLDTVGRVIQVSVEAGTSSVRSVRFEVSDPTKAENEALNKAVEAARVKADGMASAAGVGVTGVAQIVENGANRPIYPQPVGYAVSAGAALEATVVAPDSIDSRASVTVTWSVG
jgi:uncharacterized protein YggE